MGHSARTITFSTRRDAWIAAIIWAGAAGAIAGGLAHLNSGPPTLARGLLFLVHAAAGAFMVWVLYATSYTLDETELRVRSGPFRYRVPLAEIESVTPSRDPRSGPAGSLDRLLVRWGPRGRLLISPDRRREFLRELSKRCPHLVGRGDERTRERAA